MPPRGPITQETRDWETVGNILARHGLAPAPERKKKTTWREFVRTHIHLLAATDFFTAEVWTHAGQITFHEPIPEPHPGCGRLHGRHPALRLLDDIQSPYRLVGAPCLAAVRSASPKERALG